MEKCPICENEEIDKEHRYCKICGYKFQEQKIVDIIKDEEGITARILANDLQIRRSANGNNYNYRQRS